MGRWPGWRGFAEVVVSGIRASTLAGAGNGMYPQGCLKR